MTSRIGGEVVGWPAMVTILQFGIYRLNLAYNLGRGSETRWPINQAQAQQKGKTPSNSWATEKNRRFPCLWITHVVYASAHWCCPKTGAKAELRHVAAIVKNKIYRISTPTIEKRGRGEGHVFTSDAMSACEHHHGPMRETISGWNALRFALSMHTSVAFAPSRVCHVIGRGEFSMLSDVESLLCYRTRRVIDIKKAQCPNSSGLSYPFATESAFGAISLPALYSK